MICSRRTSLLLTIVPAGRVSAGGSVLEGQAASEAKEEIIFLTSKDLMFDDYRR